METVVMSIQIIQSKIAFTWKSNSKYHNNNFLFSRTRAIKIKPSPKFPFLTSRRSRSCFSSLQPSPSPAEVETFHDHQTLLEELRNKDSCPLQLLTDYRDWSKDHFWAVITFLKHSSRSHQILQVFDMWKNIDKSRVNDFNYDKIIGLLGEEGMIEEAVLAYREMKSHGLVPSLGTYNSIIHGFARKGNFDYALFFLDEMKEANLAPETDTYDGLIEAYGKYRMYDEMGMCVKNMKLTGCSPDHITYNLLIREFSRAGLLKRMERVYQTMFSKNMYLQSSTLVAMLETYARFGILEKMEKIYKRVLNSKAPLKEDLIRKLAGVYIDNYMFSRLEDLGLDLKSRFGATDLVWCLRLLSHACLSSRKGVDSIIREMKEEEVSWNVTVANIVILAYLKMKDFTHLRIFLSKLPSHHVIPDIVTVGVLFDAKRIGFNGTGTLETWKRMGYLYRVVEMNTDSLVLTAFGKGHFLRNCEEVFCSLEPEAREKKTWIYHSLIDCVEI